MANSDKNISSAVIKRLPRYFRYLGALKARNITRISSKELSEQMMVTAVSYTHLDVYKRQNLAFSLQLQAQAAKKYPGFTRKIYMKGYRYNLHYRGRSLLVEVGAQNNTLSQAKASMSLLDVYKRQGNPHPTM